VHLQTLPIGRIRYCAARRKSKIEQISITSRAARATLDTDTARAASGVSVTVHFHVLYLERTARGVSAPLVLFVPTLVGSLAP